MRRSKSSLGGGGRGALVHRVGGAAAVDRAGGGSNRADGRDVPAALRSARRPCRSDLVPCTRRATDRPSLVRARIATGREPCPSRYAVGSASRISGRVCRRDWSRAPTCKSRRDAARPSIDRVRRRAIPAIGLQADVRHAPASAGRPRAPCARASSLRRTTTPCRPAASRSATTAARSTGRRASRPGATTRSRRIRPSMRAGAGPARSIAMQPAAFRERLVQGATPKVSRAEALASATPAPADGAPVLASFAAPAAAAGPNLSRVPQTAARGRTSRLCSIGERGARERKCLAEAVYFEARSEPEEGSGGRRAGRAQPGDERALPARASAASSTRTARTTRRASSPSPARARRSASASPRRGARPSGSPTRWSRARPTCPTSAARRTTMPNTFGRAGRDAW